MSKFITVSIAILTLSIPAFTQIIPPDTLWTNTFGGAGFDEGRSVQQTSDGGYIIAGSFTYLASSLDVFLIKTDSLGNPEWDRNFGGFGSDEGFSVQQTPDGGYIITGYTTSSGTGMADVYLIRTGEDGDTLWTRTFGTNLDDKGFSVQPTPDGGYIITGYTTDELDSSQVYLIKADSSGNLLWQQTFGGSYADEGHCVQPTPDGGYIITGYTTTMLDSSNVYLIKTNPSGNPEWTQSFGGGGSDGGHSVMPITEGGYIITGYTASGIADDGRDIYLIKTDSRGDTIWTCAFGGDGLDEGHSVIPTTEGGYIITGYTTSGGTDSYQALVMYADSNGDSLWNIFIGGDGNDGGFSIKQSGDGGFIIAGFTDSYGAGQEDAWLIRMDGIHEAMVNLTPHNTPIIIPENGGSFEFDIEITNNINSIQTFDLWTQIYYTGDPAFVVPVLTVTGISLPPTFTVIRLREQDIPPYAPGGIYNYNAFVGEYPWVVEDMNSFNFEKEGGDGILGSPSDWLCRGELFDGEARVYPEPESFMLFSAYPNPFNEKTALSYQLQAASYVELTVYDVNGREVARLAEGFYTAGIHQVVFDGSEFSSGIYFARLQTEGFSQTRKLLLIK
ncbi:MAG: T9SS type A sorting domain-containing protein [candidate division Zixibacteria bacterium]|nr:T9SS type A sorting domain-containing protein [Candidatus Tariuqbacter arcticus]